MTLTPSSRASPDYRNETPLSNGSFVSNAGVYAHTGCSGTVVGSPKNCAAPTAADPNYAAEVSTVPAYQAVPANTSANCPGKVMTFQPGYYDNAARCPI